MGQRKWIATLMIVIAGLMFGCAGKDFGNERTEPKAVAKEKDMIETRRETSKEEILVAAAISLKNVYEEKLIPMFQVQHPGVTVKGTYDSSGKLQTQIQEGLEADVFMPAAQKQMRALVKEGLIAPESVVNLLENKIVLIVPPGNENELETFEDIEKVNRIALGDPASVPAGQYAREALTSLGLWDELQERLSLGSHVTEVLNQVAAASADAGIVYATDAAFIEDRVYVVAEAPDGSISEKIIYPAAVIKNSTHPDTAEKFVEFLQTEAAMRVFESYGFSRGE